MLGTLEGGRDIVLGVKRKRKIVQNQSASDCEKMNSSALLFKGNAKLKKGQNRKKGGKGSFKDHHHQNTVHQNKAGESV